MHRNLETDIELFHAHLFILAQDRQDIGSADIIIYWGKWMKNIRAACAAIYTHVHAQAKAVKVFINIQINLLCHARPNLHTFKHAPTHNYTYSPHLSFLLCFLFPETLAWCIRASVTQAGGCGEGGTAVIDGLRIMHDWLCD